MGIGPHRLRRDSTSAHDLDEVCASLKLLPGCLQHLWDTVACAAERLGMPATASSVVRARRAKVRVATC